MLAACLFVWLAPPALATDASYCVTCKNPDQTYRCRVTGDAPKAADAIKLYCIIRTAQDGKHSSCSAERKTSGCGGPEKIYAYDGATLSSLIAADPRVRGAIEQVQRQQDSFAKPKGAAPSTVFELGGRAVSASRQGWQSARTRIGGSSSGEPVSSQPAPSASAPPPPQAAAPTVAPESAPLPASAPAEAASATATPSPAPPSESRMRRASSAVGGFARKSYRCMRSFFRSCSDETTSTLQ